MYNEDTHTAWKTAPIIYVSVYSTAINTLIVDVDPILNAILHKRKFTVGFSLAEYDFVVVVCIFSVWVLSTVVFFFSLFMLASLSSFTFHRSDGNDSHSRLLRYTKFVACHLCTKHMNHDSWSCVVSFDERITSSCTWCCYCENCCGSKSRSPTANFIVAFFQQLIHRTNRLETEFELSFAL